MEKRGTVGTVLQAAKEGMHREEIMDTLVELIKEVEEVSGADAPVAQKGRKLLERLG